MTDHSERGEGERARRDPMFARSDILYAAEEFVDAVAEHADPSWHDEDKDELALALTDRALAVLRNPTARWDHDGDPAQDGAPRV